MSRLEELTKNLCPDGVEYKPLEDCCIILDRKRKPVTKSARENGEYPYYGANGILDYVSDYIFDGVYVLVGEDGSVITPNGNPVVNWATGKIWVNNHAHIIEEKEGVRLRYIYHYLQTVNVSHLIHGNIPKLTGGDFRALQIPVPPLEVQDEIVRILDNFTNLTAELTAELESRKKQYEFYRDSLLSFEKNGGVQRVKLGDVCDVFTGGEAPSDCIKSEVPDEKHPFAVWGNGKDVYGYSGTYRIDKDAVVISSIGANTGAVYFRKAYFTPIIRLKVIVPKDETVDIRFLFHALSATKIESKSSSVPNMNASEIKSIAILLPSIEEQKIIASILDAFSNLCNEIDNGIPLEINAREKQYKYYRDKLLSFN